VLTNLGFECVVRGLRLGRKMTRPDWESGKYVVLDEHTIKVYYPTQKRMSEYMFSSEEVLAKDWMILS
jgi:hypothetical protein